MSHSLDPQPPGTLTKTHATSQNVVIEVVCVLLEIKFTTVTFGVTSSQIIKIQCVKKHSDKTRQRDCFPCFEQD